MSPSDIERLFIPPPPPASNTLTHLPPPLLLCRCGPSVEFFVKGDGGGGGPELPTEASSGAVISAVGALHMGRYEGRYEGPRDSAAQVGGLGGGGPRWFRSAGDAPLSLSAARVRLVLMQLSSGTSGEHPTGSGTSGETVQSFRAAGGMTAAAAAVAATQSVNTVSASPHTQGAHLLQELMLLLEGVAAEAASEPQASDHLARHPATPAPFSTPSSFSSSHPQQLSPLSPQRQLISDSLPLVTHSLALVHGLVILMGPPVFAAAAAAATASATLPTTATATAAVSSDAAARMGNATGAPSTGSSAVGIAGGPLPSLPPHIPSVNIPGRELLVMITRLYRLYGAHGQQYGEAVLGPLGAVLAEVLALMEQHQLKVGGGSRALLDPHNPHLFTHPPPLPGPHPPVPPHSPCCRCLPLPCYELLRALLAAHLPLGARCRPSTIHTCSHLYVCRLWPLPFCVATC